MAGKGTPATAAAQRAKVRHTLHEYAHDPANRNFGTEAVEALGLDPRRTFKTLIAAPATPGSSPCCAVVPVVAQLDVKALAAILSVKQLTLADPAVAERLTGYLVGGISPIGQKKRLATVIDTSAENFDTVFVSAGRRGLEIELSPADLAALTGARFAPIARVS